jgi:hypothetical protein
LFSAIKTVLEEIGLKINKIVEWIGGIWETFTTWASETWNTVYNGFMDLIYWPYDAIVVPFFDWAINTINGLFGTNFTTFSQLYGRILTTAKANDKNTENNETHETAKLSELAKYAFSGADELWNYTKATVSVGGDNIQDIFT